MDTSDVFDLVILNNRDEFLSAVSSATINQCNEWGENLLHKAVAYNNTELGEEAIRRGIDVNHQNEDGETPLHYAAAHRNLAVAKRIVEAGGNVNTCDRHGNSPLWTAVYEANKAINEGSYVLVQPDLEERGVELAGQGLGPLVHLDSIVQVVEGMATGSSSLCRGSSGRGMVRRWQSSRAAS